MKKITLLLLLLSSCYLTFGQVILSEDFESGISLPTGWTNNEITSIGNVWTFESGGFAKYLGPANTSFYSEAGFSGNYTIFDSDGFGGGPEEAALESPVFDCTGLTSIILSYNHLFISGFGGEAYVEVYDGSTWVEVVSYSEPGIAAKTFIAGNVVIDVTTQLVGVSNAQVRFRWVGNNSYYWGLDDIIVQQPTSAPNPVINPFPDDAEVDIAINAANSDSVLIVWENDPAGDPATSYDVYLGFSPTSLTLLGNTSNNAVNLTRMQYSTLYYWQVVARNEIGMATSSSIWSFTTEANPSLSIEENQIKTLTVYPNPVKDIVNIKTNETIDGVIIINQLGQSVLEIGKNNIFNNQVNLESLTKGLYFMNVKSENKVQSIKIIKK